MARNDPKKSKSPAADAVGGRIEQVLLSQLDISPLNVRRTEPEVSPESELTQSIMAHGLLQPLIGYLAKSGMAVVLICAGQRRLQALRHVAAPETPIPVRIVDEDTAIEISLAENLERRDMNPADEVLAFKALLELGTYDAARIATRFGFTLQHVRRRLKMAALLPEILDVLREGTITIDAAAAYAAASEEVQRDVFKKHNAKGAWKPHEPAAIRQDIALHGISSNSAVARFVGGVEAYKAAGGTTIDEDFADLFADGQGDARLRDVGVVRKLIERRQGELAGEAAALAQEAMPFVTGIEWMDLMGTSYGSSVPKPGKKSGMIAVEQGWGPEGAKAFAERAKACAEMGAPVIALVDVASDGSLRIVGGKLIVDKDGWEKSKPADAPDDADIEHRMMTPEEQAALARERDVIAQMQKLYALSLIGDTPGWGVTSARFDRHHERYSVTLTRLDADNSDHRLLR